MTTHSPTLDLLSESYGAVYASLTDLRETFHRSGRLDDSNAKLDEIAKLFATYLAYRRGLIPAFPEATSLHLIQDLQEAFGAAAHLPQYVWSTSNHSIFGAEPKLILREGDEVLARDLTALVRQCVDLAYQLREDGRPFDILNEAFGHFVRDNFRGNVEDAQYMTPPEAVDFMVDLLLHDIEAEYGKERGRSLTVLDPSCGVGSFLTTFYHRARNRATLDLTKLNLIGQDKVERMARLATINLELFDVAEHRVEIGNSLEKGSALDSLSGKVDAILTNPPFGARFGGDEVRFSCGDNTPFFSELRRTIPSIDSELLFVDRNLQLLKDGGRLLIVIPDGVVSAKGTAALLRQHLSGKATLKAVIELPAVTFAQAGTRTKTAIIYLQKGRAKPPQATFIAVATDLGFQVSSRKGVQIKQTEGRNHLPAILDCYLQAKRSPAPPHGIVLSRNPSCVVIDEAEVLRSSWTPNHYSAERLDAISAVETREGLRMVPLRELVEFCSDERRNEKWKPGMAFLSVLHVLGEGLIDMSAARGYSPKTPGTPTNAGEILVSRINPRIPRVCITPDFGARTLCSSEFEVLRAKQGVDNYLLAYLLLTDAVQSQIRSLTSGTSASHNRIRSAELASVLVPMPIQGSAKEAWLNKLAGQYRAALTAMAQASAEVALLRLGEQELLQ